MKLVIAEKASVGRSLAKVIGADKEHEGYLEGNGYLVSWCIGHLIRMAEPDAYDKKYRKWKTEDLPILPETFRWETDPDKERQFRLLKELMNSDRVEELIEATDAGREGELIFRLVYLQAGCKKPFKRLWISSMEDVSIREGFASLRDGHDYDPLFQAALCRAQADWLVGINATRLFTTLYNKRLVVGRVQTPTLAMLSEREQKIKSFAKEKYFSVHLDCGSFEAIKDKIFSEEDAKEIQMKCDGADAEVSVVRQNVRNIEPPELYDLTTLQREANRYFGYSAKQTLDAAQKLYEKKLVTYPRTDSRYLTEDMQEGVSQVIESLKDLYFENAGDLPQPDISCITDGQKVTDHHALIPTAETAVSDLSGLTDIQRNILDLVCGQLLCASGQTHSYLDKEASVACMEETFTVRGREILDEGWKRIEKNCKLRRCPKKKKVQDEPPVLPEIEYGQKFRFVKSSIKEHFTTPPKHLTEDTLLSAMETAGREHFDEDVERKGLGTSATRAGIIEKLVSSGYVQRKGRQLIPTQEGMQLVEVMPQEIQSPLLTAQWEHALLQIEKGEVPPDEFMEGIRKMIKDLTQQAGTIPEEERNRFGTQKGREQVGICPRCGAPVYEGKKSFCCSSRSCTFCLWKENKWLSGMRKTINTDMAKSLLADGRVHVTGLYSRKKNRNFNADLLIRDEGDRVGFRLEFPK